MSKRYPVLFSLDVDEEIIEGVVVERHYEVTAHRGDGFHASFEGSHDECVATRDEWSDDQGTIPFVAPWNPEEVPF